MSFEKKKKPPPERGLGSRANYILIHAAHAAMPPAWPAREPVCLPSVRPPWLRWSTAEPPRKKRSVGKAGHLGRIDDPGLDQVFESAGFGIETHGVFVVFHFSTTTEPSKPRYWRSDGAVLPGARLTISMPCLVSPVALMSLRAGCNGSEPRRRQHNAFFDGRASSVQASSTRAFFSFISTSVAAPTLLTATPPISLARRSCSFSRS